MKFREAKEQFEHALNNQKSISITKLKKLMKSMNMTLESLHSKRARRQRERIGKLQERVNNQRKEIARLKGE